LAKDAPDLTTSVSVSGYESDSDSTAAGMGEPLTLPGILTNHLYSVMDRLELRVRDVTLQLDIDISEPTSSAPELVTLRLDLQDVDVEGVTKETSTEVEPRNFVPKPGKRHVLLSNVRASIISEANLFTAMARSPSIPSSFASQSPVASSRGPPFREHSTLSTSQISQPRMDSASLDAVGGDFRDSEEALGIPYDFGPSIDDEDNAMPSSPLSTPRASLHQDISPVSHASQTYRNTSPTQDLEQSSFYHDSGTYSENQSLESFEKSRSASPPTSSHFFYSSKEKGNSPMSVSKEDLTQSRFFTHDEAESMYMSAMSEIPAAQSSTLRQTPMPGGWSPTEPSPSTSPTRSRVSQKHGSETAYEGSSNTSTLLPVETAEAISSPGRHSPPRAESIDTSQSIELDTIEDDTGTDNNEAQDEPTTPRRLARLAKEVLALQSISIYLPAIHDNVTVPATLEASRMHQSTSPNLPGGFSTYGNVVSLAQEHDSGKVGTGTVKVSVNTEATSDQVNKLIEVTLAPLEVRFDMSIGFLLAKVVGELLKAIRGHQPNQPRASATSSSNPPTTPDIKLTIEKVSLLFMEKLNAVSETGQMAMSLEPNAFGQDVLLQTILQRIIVCTTTLPTAREISVELGRFKFGYSDDDILAFDQQISMQSSVSDAMLTRGGDVSVTIKQTKDSTRYEVFTLPLFAKLDLQRLDETFSWFGGLSSFLNMGSSFTSTASGSTKPSSKMPPKAKQARVQFQTPVNPHDKSAASENKHNVRIGGFQLQLVGKDCSVSVQSSSLKMVQRDVGLGIRVNDIRLSGPYLRNSHAGAPITVDIRDVWLNHRPMPMESDLEKLLSKVKFDDGDDVIMVDTLLRQRRKGPVVEFKCQGVAVNVRDTAQLQCLPALGEELARLGTVAKYLPEDDRPGLLSLVSVQDVQLSVELESQLGMIQSQLKALEAAHITVPSLIAFTVGAATVKRNGSQELVGSSWAKPATSSPRPVVMFRMIGDVVEPVINITLCRLSVEYHVATVMDFLGLGQESTPEEFEEHLAASIANLGEQAHHAISGSLAQETQVPIKSTASTKPPVTVDLVFRECLIGLNPHQMKAKLNVALVDAHVEVLLPKDGQVTASAELKKVNLLLTNDVSTIEPTSANKTGSDLTTMLEATGFVPICQLTSARARILATTDKDGEKRTEVDIQDCLLVMETCADSTQTLAALGNALTPPTPPSKAAKYKTEIVPVKDLFDSIHPDYFGQAEGNYNLEDDFAIPDDSASLSDFEDFEDIDDESPFIVPDPEPPVSDDVAEMLFDAASMTTERPDPKTLARAELKIIHDYFGGALTMNRKSRRWNSKRATREVCQPDEKYPLQVRVRKVHVIWHLYDGFDWRHTQDVMNQQVQDLKARAYDRANRRRPAESDDEEEESVVNDCLFNSIYINIPANADPEGLSAAINAAVRGRANDLETVDGTSVAATSTRTVGVRKRARSGSLKLRRSKRHRMSIELTGLDVDLFTFPASTSETQTYVDVNVEDFHVFDAIPTSSWRTFASYDQDNGARPIERKLLHLEVFVVRPVKGLTATELVIFLDALPIRVHADQDAVDFMARFFEFKDNSVPIHQSTSDMPFIQRCEVQTIPVQMDFKPKRVDYGSIRAGNTTEFMNFVHLDSFRMELVHTLVYGCLGFDRLAQTLKGTWLPDIRSRQLHRVAAGVSLMRPMVDVASGLQNLIEIPRDYQRDGRLMRALSKGATSFALNTGTGLLKLGAKVATGTQYALQTVEGVIAPQSAELGSSRGSHRRTSSGRVNRDSWPPTESESEDDVQKEISLYANQPTGVRQGVRHAYKALARDLSIAKDAIIAVPAEVQEATSAAGAVGALARHTPTIVFKPLLGVSKAVGQTLMGATNTLDPQNLRRAEDVSAISGGYLGSLERDR
jgi:autophagy-related protein 2